MDMGDPTLTDLYRRIVAFYIDGELRELSFERRLARENSWTIPFARRVIIEYRRFVFLMAAADHAVTPSDQVDQAWHLHLTYTQSYWDRLCGEIVGRPLHHVPTEGGADESEKFDRWYQRTLDTYERFFGDSPSPDIWPEPAVRFGDDLHFQRINTRRNWVFGKPLQTARRLSMVATLLWVAALLPALAVLGSSTPGVAQDGMYIIFDPEYLVPAVFLLIFCVGGAVKLLSDRPRCSKCGRTRLEKLDSRFNQLGFLTNDYRCKKCGNRFSHVLSKTDERKGSGSGGGCGGCGSGSGGE